MSLLCDIQSYQDDIFSGSEKAEDKSDANTFDSSSTLNIAYPAGVSKRTSICDRSDGKKWKKNIDQS